MESEERVNQYIPNQDKGSILEYINPQSDVVNIINNMLGLHVVYSKEKNKEGGIKILTTRISKPEFTKEYVMGLAKDLNVFLNFTIQVSKFGEEKVNTKMRNYMLALAKDLCTDADDNFISNNSWQKILNIHHDGMTDKNGQFHSGWERFGIIWKINDPVDYQMLQLVKDFQEEVDQVIKYEKISATLSAIIEASFNKSSSVRSQEVGMLLLALGEMRSESTILKEKEEKKKGFFGFGKKEEQKPEGDWK
jgi:hypothetical protein